MKPSTMRVLGLDAAFANCGMVVADIGLGDTTTVSPVFLELITTTADKTKKKVVRKNSDDLRRTKEIASAIREAILKDKIDLVMVEVPTGAQSARAAWGLGIVVGVLGSIQVPIIEVTPREVKLAVGDKYAEKDEIIAWAVAKYPELNWPRKGDGSITVTKAEHLADAVAVLHAGVSTEEFGRMKTVWKMFKPGS